MAAQYDQLGNYLGDWETEEEREKREQELANRTVLTQEVKTYGDGTVERTTTEEMAPTIQPVAVKPVQQMPVAQPVQQPVSPDTFNRMIQAESRGQNFDAQGRPLTSPKGALFAAQVMPSTAAQPGFGVRPAQAQTPEEYNRVGQEYYQAMLQQFGGDEQKAAAAYNAGPGRVQQAQAAAAQRGGSWTDYIPKETMNYLGQVFNKMIPSAQAATLPATQAQQPATITQPAQQPAQTRAQQQMAIVTGQTQQPTSAAGIEAYQQVQDDPMKLLALRNDESAPKWIRERAGTRAFELMDAEVKQKQAAEQVKSLVAAAGAGDRKASNTIARELQNQEGSWIKMLLLGFISPQLAGEEAVKLGFGNKWTQGYDAEGKSALIQVNAKGLPLKGYTADGNAIDDNNLAAYMVGGKVGMTKADVSTQDVERNGQAGRVITQHMPNGQTKTMVESGGKLFPYDTSWKPRSIATSQAKADYGLITDLKKKHGTNVLDAEKDYVSINGPFKSAEERQQFRQAYGFDLAQPSGQAPTGGPVAPATMGAGQAPVSGPAVPGAPQTAPAPQAAPSNVGVPLQTQKDLAEARKTKLKEEAEVLGKDIGTIRANQGKNEATSDYLLTKIDELVTHPGFEVSVGATVQPGFQYIPGTDKSDWYSRFKEVKGQAFLQAFETLKGGGQITEAEGRAATEALQRMDTSQSEKEFRAAATDFSNIVKRSVDRNRQKLGQEVIYGTKPESQLAVERKTETQNMTPAERARAELERRRKEKK